MTRKQALAQFQSELHVSYSQIFTYSNCSLKYKFQYVENRPMERVSIALVFGSAIHSAIERYYHSLKNKGVVEPLEAICEIFEESFEADFEKREVPIIYKKETPNKKSAIETGKGLLKVFYENIDMTGFEIVAIELPLTARLYTDEKQPTELILTGIIDLLLKDAKGPTLQEIVAQLAGQCQCFLVGKSADKFLGTSYRYIEKYAGQIKMTPHKACMKVISDTEKVLQLILGAPEASLNAETSEMATA